MLRLSEQKLPHQDQRLRLSGNYRYFCLLFEDMITEGLCRLRRSELNSSEALSCDGCSKDTLLRSRFGRQEGLSNA